MGGGVNQSPKVIKRWNVTQGSVQQLMESSIDCVKRPICSAPWRRFEFIGLSRDAEKLELSLKDER